MCSRNGSAKLVGKCTLLPEMDEEMSFGAFMTIIRTRHNPYLLHFFNSNAFRCQLGSAATTTINQITRKMLDDISVPLYPKEQEDYIVSLFNQIDELIWTETQKLELCDELVKSRFIELFGDPMDNPKGWDKVNISAVVGGKVSNGFFAKRDDYCDDGNVKVLGVAHVVNRMYSNTEGLPKTNGTEADIAKYGVKYGDMLFCRSSLVAAGIGKASIVPKNVPSNVLFECHVIRLPLDLTKCVPEFMQVLSTTEYFRSQVIAQSKTATMTTIGQDGILKTDIILPPLEKQKQFLQFVEQTDKSKWVVQQSIAELEELKKSLMQQYFG
jgi:type I restriction enzyme S subunit